MRSLVVLALVWCCSAQVVFPGRYGIPFPWQQYRLQDAFGQTTFGHFSFDQNRQETRLADGRVVGHFSFLDPKGKPSVTFYEAGPEGYRVHANNLPVAPTFDLVAPVDDNVAPEPVQYTPEVAQAREVFQAAFDEAKKKDAPITREKRQATFFALPVDETKPFLPSIYHHFSPFTPYSAPFNPYIYQSHFVVPKLKEEGRKEEAVETARRRRDVEAVQIPLPYLHPQPTLVDHKFKTQQFEPVEAATPSDTTKIELKTKEHKVSVPSVKYVQPVVGVKPHPYTTMYSAIHPLTYTAFSSGEPINYGAFPYYYSYSPFFVPKTA